MKTTVFAIALILTISISGMASNVQSAKSNQTENTTVAKSNSVAGKKTGITKNGHSKKHKNESGTKKTK